MTFSLIALLLSLLLDVAAAEIMVRLLSPQNLSGSWRVQSSQRGYVMNKAGGEARHQFEDRVVSYRFNELHMRGGAIEPDVPKILVLGDSYTFGSLIEDKDTYVALLQTRRMSGRGCTPSSAKFWTCTPPRAVRSSRVSGGDLLTAELCAGSC